MLYTVGYTASLGSVTDSDVPAMVDPTVTINNNHVVPPVDMKVVAAYTQGNTLGRSRLSTPKLRNLILPWIQPQTVGAAVPTDPNVADYRTSPLGLIATEEISWLFTTTAVGPAQTFGFLWLSDGRVPLPPGEIVTMRGTSTTAAVANAWTALSVSWSDALPAGRYALVGSCVFSATAVVHRWSFPGQPNRPGAVSQTSEGGRTHDMFRRGGLGVFGTFLQNALPIPEVVCTAADASHVVYMDIVKIA